MFERVAAHFLAPSAAILTDEIAAALEFIARRGDL
jgi:hypothetical protein